MRRKCGRCRQPLRWDESLGVCVVEGEGHYKACPRCVAESLGTQPPPPRVYPVEDDAPAHPYRDDYLPICGLCRTALFEGERTSRLRLQAEDVEGTDTEAGGYCACPRCIQTWKPVVIARLLREGLVREGTPAAAVGGRALG